MEAQMGAPSAEAVEVVEYVEEKEEEEEEEEEVGSRGRFFNLTSSKPESE